MLYHEGSSAGAGKSGGKNSMEDRSSLLTPGSPINIRQTDNRSQLTAGNITPINKDGALNESKRAHQTVDTNLMPPRSTDKSGFSIKKNLF